jgi:glycosyltransferase involved in cell wall biosynthesis
VPSVTIVVAASNAEKFLAATIDSVLAQSHRNWECIVVENGSRDSTLAIARRYEALDGRVRALHVDQVGVSKARNAGFRASDPKADYCTFMDSDDIWLPHALEVLLKRAEQDRATTIGAHAVGEFIDATGNALHPGAFSTRGRRRVGIVGRALVEMPMASPTSFAMIMFGTMVFPPGLALVRRRVYMEAGPFDESLSGGEDWEMLTRLSRIGPIAFVPDVILQYRLHGANAGAKETAPGQVHRAFCQSFYSPLNSSAERDLLRRGWRASQRQRIHGNWSEIRKRGLRSPRATSKQLGQCGVWAVRWLRGSPRPVIRKEPAAW